MRKRHHMQVAKQMNQDLVRKWISEAGGIEKINVKALLRKCELVIGCSKVKGIEYIEAVTGKDISV